MPAKKAPAKKAPAQTGRPTKLTPDVQQRILDALSAGNYVETAVRYAGVSPTTFYRWMEEGARDDADPARREFRDAVESARAQAEIRAVTLIQRAAAGGTWQAAAWFLERSAPRRWGRYQRTEISGPDGGPVEVSVADLEAKIAALLGEDDAPVEGDG